MTHEKRQLLFAAYAAGDLAEDEDRALRSILEADPAAMDELRAYLRLEQAAGLLLRGTLDGETIRTRVMIDLQEKARPELTASVLKRVQRETGRRGRRRSSLRAMRAARRSSGFHVAAAAVLVLACLAGLALLRGSNGLRDRRVAHRQEQPVLERNPVLPGPERALHPRGGNQETPAGTAPRRIARDDTPRGESHGESHDPDPAQTVPEQRPTETHLAERSGPAPKAESREPKADGPSSTSEKPVAVIALVKGAVKYARGDKGEWAKAVEGIRLLPGDRVDTHTGRARIDYDGGALLYANRNTRFRVKAERLVALARGEVYVEEVSGLGSRVSSRTAPSPGPATRDPRPATRRIRVETADGLFTPVGTRFNLKLSGSATIVTVEEGIVHAQAKKHGGRVRVEAGQQSRVRAGAAPSRPRPVSVKRIVAWVGRVRGVLFAADLTKGFPRTLAFSRSGNPPPNPVPGQPLVRFRNGRAELAWRSSPPYWSWGTIAFPPGKSFDLPVAVSADVALSRPARNLMFTIGVRGETSGYLRFHSRGGRDVLSHGSGTRELWGEDVGKEVASLRTIELAFREKNVTVRIDGVEKFRGAHGLSGGRVRITWSFGFKLDPAPAGYTIDNLVVRRVP